MSFILDALRKSEHERQRSSSPGLAQVPLATPPAQLPRWALIVIGVLAAAVLVMGGAWWQSTRAPAEFEPAAASVEESVQLPPAAPLPVTPLPATRTTPLVEPGVRTPPPAQALLPEPPRASSLATAVAPAEPPLVEPSFAPAADSEPALPSAAALAAEGIVLPTLQLELHRYREQSRDRFVFINGRKYVEGDRLLEGPQLVSIVPTGAVLVHAGRRFLLGPE